jgi:hypothetical protein
MTTTKRFILNRTTDATGTSGTGIIADGVEFPSGKCVIHFRPAPGSIIIFDSVSDMESVHGHNGQTQIVWID